jgi:endoglucanase
MVSFPLKTSGRYITDSAGKRVKLAGANWAGGHEDLMVPGGLRYRHRDDIAKMVRQDLGLNSVRLTLSVRTVTYAGPADAASLAANPDLTAAKATPFQVYQACAEALAAQEIIVIPNIHTIFSGWCCSDADGQGLWWNSNWTPARFFGAWQEVARAFAGNPWVAAMDIKNEPHNATFGGKTYRPTWDENAQTGFLGMYQKAGNLIHQVNPDPLIICEGLGYATSLSGVASRPVTLDHPGKVVYSLHDYPWDHASGQSRSDYLADMHRRGGFVTDAGHSYTAPLWVGEFGVSNSSPAALGLAQGGSSSPDKGMAGWWENFMAWAESLDVDWCWWHLSGTHVLGTEPQTNRLIYTEGDRCTSGLLAQDWQGPSSPYLVSQLQALAVPKTGPGA